MATMFKVGDFVGAANNHAVMDGVVVGVKGDRVLICENVFAASMMHLGVTLEHVKQEFKCRWFNADEVELDDDGEWEDDDNG